MSEQLVQSVIKALKALDIMGLEDYARNGIPLSELSRRLDIKSNTLHNLLKTMIYCGYVAQTESSKYIAGEKCFQLGLLNKLTSPAILERKIEPIIRQLSENIGESISLAVLSNGERLVLKYINAQHPVRVELGLLEKDNIYEKNTGRILVAFADNNNRLLITEKWGYPGEKWDGIDDKMKLEEKLHQIRNDGHIITVEKQLEIVSMAVPVKLKNYNILGALGAYAPIFRCEENRQLGIMRQLKLTAEVLSEI